LLFGCAASLIDRKEDMSYSPVPFQISGQKNESRSLINLILNLNQKNVSKKLYVGNLDYNTTEDDLQKLFSEAGKVESVSIIRDRQTDRSKGFGFVEMATEEEAEKAIEILNGKPFEGREIKVAEARPRRERF
jgi:RNA recognition motif-containing protein